MSTVTPKKLKLFLLHRKYDIFSIGKLKKEEKMPYSTRLATSVHILLAIYHFENKEKVTSTFLADSIQTNPVIVRN